MASIHFPWQGPDDPPHRNKGKDYKQDKWGLIPDPSNVQPHVKAMVEAAKANEGVVQVGFQRRQAGAVRQAA